MMWETNEGMGWWMVFGGILWILFWASLIYLFVTAIVRPGRHGEAGEQASAMELAKRRYARGEISAQEYEEIRRHLEGGATGGLTT